MANQRSEVNWYQRMRELPGDILEEILREFVATAYGTRNYYLRINTIPGSAKWTDTVLIIYIPADCNKYKTGNSFPGWFRTHLHAFKAIWPVQFKIIFEVKAYQVRGDNIGYPQMLLWISRVTAGLPATVRIKIPAFQAWILPHCLKRTKWLMYKQKVEERGIVNVNRRLKGYYTQRDLIEDSDELTAYTL